MTTKRLAVTGISILLLFSVSATYERSEAADPLQISDWTGCPYRSGYSVDPGPAYSVSWSVSGEAAVISFQADKIVFGGGKGMMSAGQLGRWRPFLDELRDAAVAKRKVRVFYDASSRNIVGFNILYDQPCN